MANVLYGGGVIDARGSVGGTTMSRAKFGPTHRAKISPIQPRAFRQQKSRNLLGYLSNYWSSGLTAGQQASWNAYALTTPVTNVFGQTSYLSGHQMFVRLSANMTNSGSMFSLTPPGATAQAGLLTLSITSTHGPGNELILTYTAGAMPGTASLYVFATQSLSPGISYVNNKFKFIGATGFAGSPKNMSSQYMARFSSVEPLIGRKIFVLVQVVDNATGLISAPLMASAIVT